MCRIKQKKKEKNFRTSKKRKGKNSQNSMMKKVYKADVDALMERHSRKRVKSWI